MTQADLMIVEDEFIIQAELIIRVEKLGYQVVAIASQAEEAIKKAEENDPDIILMDIQLEGEMDGIEAATIIKDRLDIPTIFTTAYTDEERVKRAKVSVPYGYLVKPIRDRDLKISLDMALYAARVNEERKQAEAEREKTIIELEEVLKTIKKLSGLIPICANCKKIRDDEGYWNQIESYIEKHSEALFSHSVCPECADELYGDSKWYKKSRNKIKTQSKGKDENIDH